MHLHLKFEIPWLLKYEKRGKSPIFKIFWEINGEFYPEEEWVDNGSIILSWWLVALEKILEGSKNEDLVFMEGPYRLKLRVNHKERTITVGTGKQPNILESQIDAVVGEVLGAARTTISKFEELNIAQADREDLMEGIRRVMATG